MTHRPFGALLLGTALFGCSPMPAAAPDSLDAAIAGDHRSPEYAARDRYRHPKQTLEFFGLQPDMTVVEVWPSSGWYAEILAPYLREKGTYYAAEFVTSHENAPEWRREVSAAFRKKVLDNADVYGPVRFTELGLPHFWTACPPGTADLVLTFRNVHNWMKADYEQEMFRAFFRALKPGGTLGVVEHRAKPGTSRDQMNQSGYVTEDYVIEIAEKAGFKLVARSEVNANPLDTADHPKGVWTLPPALRLGDTDREKYLGIGESDRMTLRFAKPILMAPVAE